MEKLVHYDEILEFHRLAREVISQGDYAGGRAGTPLTRHTLHADNPRLGFQPLRPVSHPLTKLLAPSVRRLHQIRRR
jgi:hypothetical protein